MGFKDELARGPVIKKSSFRSLLEAPRGLHQSPYSCDVAVSSPTFSQFNTQDNDSVYWWSVERIGSGLGIRVIFLFTSKFGTPSTFTIKVYA